jgi:guanylate kinase
VKTQTREGMLFVLVGPSGAGKNAILEGVQKRLLDLKQLPTATTRGKRPNETHGKQHLFVSPAEFEQMKNSDQLLEWEEVHEGLFYGTPRSEVAAPLEHGVNLIADIDKNGAQALRTAYPDNTILIFIRPPGDSDEAILRVLRERLETRNDVPADEIPKRLRRVQSELDFAAACDYVIVNEQLETAIEEVYGIITRKLAL